MNILEKKAKQKLKFINQEATKKNIINLYNNNPDLDGEFSPEKLADYLGLPKEEKSTWFTKDINGKIAFDLAIVFNVSVEDVVVYNEDEVYKSGLSLFKSALDDGRITSEDFEEVKKLLKELKERDGR